MIASKGARPKRSELLIRNWAQNVDQHHIPSEMVLRKISKEDERRRLKAGFHRHKNQLLRKSKQRIGLQSTALRAPEIFRFSTNGDQTIQFLRNLRRVATVQRRSLKRGKWVWPRIDIDLSKIRQISIPAAIVLSAEFQRWSLLKEVQLRPHRIREWDSRVLRLFSDLGTFELLGISKRLEPTSRSFELVLLPLRSGTKNDGQSIAALQEDLRSLGLLFDRRSYIFDGLSEAVSNCIDHAYSLVDVGEAAVPRVGLRWWATSCYDPETESLRFFVFDQGVGISSTLIRQRDWLPLLEPILKGVESVLVKAGLKKPDCEVISAAFEVGRTRTKQSERGKGLDQMAGVVREVGGGYIRVLSGRGDVRIDAKGKSNSRELGFHLGGTLVEWSVPYAALRGPIGDGSEDLDS